jgi:hypothetical protein
MCIKKAIYMMIAFCVFLGMMAGMLNAAVVKGPYLIYDGINTDMTVLWQLDCAQPCQINWGKDEACSDGTGNAAEYGSDHQYKYTVTGLAPGTEYYYQVQGVGGGSFYTAPADTAENVKFFVYGDTRTYPAVQDSVNSRMIMAYTSDPGYQTITLHVGDWVEKGDSESDWTHQFFNPVFVNSRQFQANMPITGCKGNHEGIGILFKKYFPYPYQSGGFYWSFNYGPAHIAVVDQYVSYASGSAQYVWLENDLSTATRQWKFLLFHEPGWSAGGHSKNSKVQKYIQPLCLKYGVDVVFAGHNHYYARCIVNGVEHITTGGGGAPLYASDAGFPYVVKVASVYHFCEVDIKGRELNFKAIDPGGAVIDEFARTHPSPEKLPAGGR